MMEKISKILDNKKTLPPREERKRFLDHRTPKEILTNGFTKIPNVILLDPALSCQDVRILLVLNFHAKGKAECWPSQKIISREAYCSLRSVKRSLKNLRKLGYINWIRTQFVNHYTLNI